MMLLVAFGTGSMLALESEYFLQPSRDQFPETWFHLIGGNVAKPGLEADLDAIASAGISGIQLFHGQFGGPWPGVTNQIPCLSREWDDMIRFTAEGCAARGLTFKMQNCPGWSMSGGPWIAPSNAMRNLTYSRTDVQGGKALRIELPVPNLPVPEIRISDADRDYHDLFVLAFSTPEGDEPSDLAPISIKTNDTKDVIRRTFRFACPVIVRSVELPSMRQMNHDWAYRLDARVAVNAVYENGALLHQVASTEIPQGCWQDAVPFTVMCEDSPDGSSAIEPTDTWTVSISHPHPLKLPFLRLWTGLRLGNWEGKAGWVLRGGMKGRPSARFGSAPCCVKGRTVIELTDRYRDGVLDWTPPEGKWTVLRIGHVNNGARNGPAPKEATGWECNKMDRSGIDTHFAAYIGRLAKGPIADGKLKGFVVDSWECRRQTWTANLEADFRSLCGYDFRLKLPAVFGWVIDTPEETETFLRDWRQTLGELVERNYYARMAELAREYGMTAQYETAFGDVLPGDLMAFWKHCDTPMCEFWFPRAEASVGQDDYKPIIPCASAAHIYGKGRVATEAFTAMHLKWDEDPKRLKACANHAFARGVTHLVFHTYTHNPRTDWKPPGSSFGTHIGTPFIRGQSWWRFMPDFTRWAARCGAMLEAGKPTNDILWFLGDDVDHKPSEKSPFPPGYKYDYVNRDALLSRIAVKDGLFTTPEGVSWKVLWVPSDVWVSPVAAARLAQFREAGGNVVRGYVESVIAGIVPDVVCSPDENGRLLTDWRRDEQPIDWLHRRDETADWYFVAANGMDAYTGEVTFRMEGNVTVWNPVTGTSYVPAIPHAEDQRTTIRLDLAPAECMFVVFSHKAGAAMPPTETLPDERDFLNLRNLRDWTLSFPAGWGAPDVLKLDRLRSWTALPIGEEGRHFSGTATYSTSFEGRKGETVELDLGEVETVAEVFVNGKAVCTLWSPPYRCAISAFVKDGVNALRVGVTSTWFNRLVFDQGLPEEDRKTWTHAAPQKGTSARPAGLLGPVTLRRWGKESKGER